MTTECPECGHQFPDEAIVGQVFHCMHRVPHAGFEITSYLEFPYRCCCGEQFLTLSSLVDHVAREGGIWLHYFRSMLGIEREP